LNDYIQQLGSKLAEYSPRRDVEYSFNVVEMAEPNAFALPGGYIYISRGLLSLANSEAEVANVIGHEIGHVAARHAAQRDTAAKAATLLTILGMVGAVAGASDGRAIAAMPYLGQGLLASYSREQERQSDRIAIELTSRAGIDPGGMARFLKQLDNSTRLQTGASRTPGFFDTHPATPQRFAEATSRAQVARWTPGFSIAPTQREFYDRIDGLVVGPAASEGVFRDNVFMHADLGFALRFPPGWIYRNSRAQVMAIAPSGDAIALLELAGPGDDPRAMAVEYAEEAGIMLTDATPIRIGDLRAFRARAQIRAGGGPVDSLITWIAYDGLVYQLAAGTPGGGLPKYDGILRSFARGFRPLRDEDREQIDELRVRIVEARAGETLEQLSERTGNAWDLNEIAVANALFVGQALEEGRLVKIARREAYEVEAQTPPEKPEEALGPVQGPLQPTAEP
jgi:predicted Zn-dependent protease